jgi:hypothetical protein
VEIAGRKRREKSRKFLQEKEVLAGKLLERRNC